MEWKVRQGKKREGREGIGEGRGEEQMEAEERGYNKDDVPG